MLGTTVIIPTALVPQMGGGNVMIKFHFYTISHYLSLYPFAFLQKEKAQVIQTLLFVAGPNTLLQSWFGTSLAVVIGGSYTFVTSIISIILSGRWSDLDPISVTLPDFFLADQFTSQAMRSFEYCICFYGRGKLSQRLIRCNNLDLYNVFYFIVAVIPYWFCFLQDYEMSIEFLSKIQGESFSSLSFPTFSINVICALLHDNTIKRFLVRNIVEQAAVRNVQEACLFLNLLLTSSMTHLVAMCEQIIRKRLIIDLMDPLEFSVAELFTGMEPGNFAVYTNFTRP